MRRAGLPTQHCWVNSWTRNEKMQIGHIGNVFLRNVDKAINALKVHQRPHLTQLQISHDFQMPPDFNLLQGEDRGLWSQTGQILSSFYTLMRFGHLKGIEWELKSLSKKSLYIFIERFNCRSTNLPKSKWILTAQNNWRGWVRGGIMNNCLRNCLVTFLPRHRWTNSGCNIRFTATFDPITPPQ